MRMKCNSWKGRIEHLQHVNGFIFKSHRSQDRLCCCISRPVHTAALHLCISARSPSWNRDTRTLYYTTEWSQRQGNKDKNVLFHCFSFISTFYIIYILMYINVVQTLTFLYDNSWRVIFISAPQIFSCTHKIKTFFSEKYWI